MGGFHWGRFEWRAGMDSYSFEFDPGGMHATLKAPNTPPLKLPVVAWDGLIEAIKTSQKARSKSQASLAPRAGARWTDEEIAELAREFEGGNSVAELARKHSRSTWAVESQLVRLGLMQRPDDYRAPPRAAHSLAPR